MHFPTWRSRWKRWHAAVVVAAIMIVTVLLISAQRASAALPMLGAEAVHAHHHQLALPRARRAGRSRAARSECPGGE